MKPDVADVKESHLRQGNWWSEATGAQRKALTATWLGWMLDAFDFTLLLLVLVDIAKTFSVDLVAMGTVITGTLFFRLIGSVIFGTWADRVGRRFPLMISILTFSIFSASSAMAPTFTWFIVLRFIFGLGMGGEWSSGTSLAMESWPQRTRGIASGVLQSGWPIGYLIATISYYLLFPIWGWRALFLIGVLPAFLTLWIRRSVPESPVFEARHEALKKRGQSEGLSVLTLFNRDIIGITLHAFLVLAGVMAAYYSVQSLWPTYLTSVLRLDIGQKTALVILFNVGSLFGFWTAGALSERVGRRLTLAIFAIIALVFVPMYAFTHELMLLGVAGVIEGFTANGLTGVVPAYLSERFPTSVRGVGPGAAFHVGAAIGSFAPTVQALFIQRGATMSLAIAVGSAATLLLLAVVVFLGPESKGTVFVVDEQAPSQAQRLQPRY